MTAEILDGRALGAEIKAELRDEVRRYLQERGRPPGLAIVRVGGDAASGMYSKAILRVAEDVGVLAHPRNPPPPCVRIGFRKIHTAGPDAAAGWLEKAAE